MQIFAMLAVLPPNPIEGQLTFGRVRFCDHLNKLLKDSSDQSQDDGLNFRPKAPGEMVSVDYVPLHSGFGEEFHQTRSIQGHPQLF